jgi:hypothetical protein
VNKHDAIQASIYGDFTPRLELRASVGWSAVSSAQEEGRMRKAAFTPVGALVLALAGTGLLAQRQTPSPGGLRVALSADGFQHVDEHGNIRRPDRIRDTFPSLGAVWVNGDPEGEMSQPPGTAAAYRLDNRFADEPYWSKRCSQARRVE